MASRYHKFIRKAIDEIIKSYPQKKSYIEIERIKGIIGIKVKVFEKVEDIIE